MFQFAPFLNLHLILGDKNVNYADNFKNVKSSCIFHNIHMYGQTDNSEQFLFKEIFLNNAKIDCSYV